MVVILLEISRKRPIDVATVSITPQVKAFARFSEIDIIAECAAECHWYLLMLMYRRAARSGTVRNYHRKVGMFLSRLIHEMTGESCLDRIALGKFDKFIDKISNAVNYRSNACGIFDTGNANGKFR
jgi:hypothetical protein